MMKSGFTTLVRGMRRMVPVLLVFGLLGVLPPRARAQDEFAGVWRAAMILTTFG